MYAPSTLGGDYQRDALDYDENTIVFDNPPFSIAQPICAYYQKKGVKFILFAPALIIPKWLTVHNVSVLVPNIRVGYENPLDPKVKINLGCSFYTNLEETPQAKTMVELTRLYRDAFPTRQAQKPLPLKPFQYSSAELAKKSLNGREVVLPYSDCVYETYDKETGRKYFGGRLTLVKPGIMETE